MARRYRAFLLRCWQLGDGGQRFEIAQVQSGATLQVASLAEALAWIGASLDARDDTGDTHGEAPAPDDEIATGEGGAAPT